MQSEWTKNALGGAYEADLHQLSMLLEHLVKAQPGHPPWVGHSVDLGVGFIRARSTEELVLQGCTSQCQQGQSNNSRQELDAVMP